MRRRIGQQGQGRDERRGDQRENRIPKYLPRNKESDGNTNRSQQDTEHSQEDDPRDQRTLSEQAIESRRQPIEQGRLLSLVDKRLRGREACLALRWSQAPILVETHPAIVSG